MHRYLCAALITCACTLPAVVQAQPELPDPPEPNRFALRGSWTFGGLFSLSYDNVESDVDGNKAETWTLGFTLGPRAEYFVLNNFALYFGPSLVIRTNGGERFQDDTTVSAGAAAGVRGYFGSRTRGMFATVTGYLSGHSTTTQSKRGDAAPEGFDASDSQSIMGGFGGGPGVALVTGKRHGGILHLNLDLSVLFSRFEIEDRDTNTEFRDITLSLSTEFRFY